MGYDFSLPGTLVTWTAPIGDRCEDDICLSNRGSMYASIGPAILPLGLSRDVVDLRAGCTGLRRESRVGKGVSRALPDVFASPFLPTT